MRRIYKYEISKDLIEKTVVVFIPKGATFLSIGHQGGGIVAWYEVDPDIVVVDHHVFYVVWTGGIAPLPHDVGNMHYRGTIVQDLVCHIYEGSAE